MDDLRSTAAWTGSPGERSGTSVPPGIHHIWHKYPA
jgi:hypothetical protein